MLQNYFKTAWRNLTRNKVYTGINLAGLAIGLAGVLLILLYISDETSFDRFHEKAQRIYRIVHDARGPEGKEEKGGNTGAPEGPAFMREIPEVENFCRLEGGGSALVKKGGDVISESIGYADTSFFDIFSFPLLQGDPATVLQDPNSVVVSKTIALKYFHNTRAVGQTMEINLDGHFQAFRVSGVADDAPQNSSIPINILLPIEPHLPSGMANRWLKNYLNTFVVLKPGADRAAMDKKMAEVFNTHVGKLFAELKKQFKNIAFAYKLQPLTDLHTNPDYHVGNGLRDGSNDRYSYILGGIALFILIIACINFVNLTLARSLHRSREIGIRKVTGGRRSQLILQFFSESFLLNGFSFALALVLTAIALPVFNELAHKKLALDFLFTTRNVLLFGALLLLNTVLTGFYPALVLSGFKPVQTLYGKMKLSGRNYLGKSLIVVQFAIALFLICGTVVMRRQFDFIRHKDLGYRTAAIIDVDLPWQEPTNINLFKNELAKYDGIRQTAVQSNWFTDINNVSVKANDRDVFNVPVFKMDAGVLPMLHIPLLQGRNFFDDRSDSLRCIVNQSMVTAAGWKDPIGKKILAGRTVDGESRELTVIGVVKDFNVSSLKENIQPVLIHQNPALRGYGTLLVRIDPQKKVAAVRAIQTVFRKLVPYYPCNYNFLDDIVASQYDSERRWESIVSIAAMMAIFISCLGLFGLATLSIEQRTREIGIRKVLGATVAAIVRGLSRDFIALVMIAILVASPAAWYFAGKWLQNFAYRTHLSAWLFGVTGLCTILVAFATIGIQAVRAARANPVKSLRSE